MNQPSLSGLMPHIHYKLDPRLPLRLFGASLYQTSNSRRATAMKANHLSHAKISARGGGSDGSQEEGEGKRQGPQRLCPPKRLGFHRFETGHPVSD